MQADACATDPVAQGLLTACLSFDVAGFGFVGNGTYSWQAKAWPKIN